MPIPEHQLATWSRQGSIDLSKRTHEAVRYALKEWEDLRNRDYEVYLQGSYRNSTNVSGSSDVDVIAQTNVFSSNKLELPRLQREAHDRVYPFDDYSLDRFRDDVLAALRKHFGHSFVVEGDKAIKILPSSGRLSADVVVCEQYRKYEYFYDHTNQTRVEGIRFITRKRRQEIINYPKPHYENGVRKNKQCSVRYKAGVRIFKNAREIIAKRGWLRSSLVPSYFLECFTYNASNHCYSENWQSLFCNVLADLAHGDYRSYICQNGVRPLFGSSYDQWDIPSATLLVAGLQRLWREWR